MSSQQPDARTALAARAEKSTDLVPLSTRIADLEPDFQLALPKGLEAKRLVRDALTCLRTIRDLDQCDPDSVLGALMTCAQLGLRPGVLGHAWPLPYWDGHAGRHRAQLVIGYQGLIELAHRSGQIASLVARTVHANDTFSVDYGLAESLVHRPNLRGDRGPAIAYYAIVRYLAGGYTFGVMTRLEVERHRDAYAPRNKQRQLFGPWVKEFDAMALKTIIRQLAKFMPKTADFAEAIAADGGIRVDRDPRMPASDVTATAGMWDGQVLDEREAPADAPPPAPEPPPVTTKPDRTRKDQLIKLVHVYRNKLDGLSGTSAEARELFLVHVASVTGREVTSTKDLTEDELETLIDDLKRAKREQDTRQHAQREPGPDAQPPDTDPTGRPLREVSAEQAQTLRAATRDPHATVDGIPF